MANDLILSYERDLNALAPTFQDVMGSTGVPPERLIRTVLISLERTPKLLECNRQTIINAAVTFGVLGLEVDGVTGQGFMIPFGGRAQPVIGYKGYNTMAARSGYSIRGAVVREGDDFAFDLGAAQPIRHSFDPMKTRKDKRIIGAWSLAEAHGRPPVPVVMTVDELLEVKAKSPGAKKSDSPWNDLGVGFPAMCEKTVKRRQARSMPLNVMQYAAAMEEAHEERGKYSFIEPGRGVVVDGDFHTLGDPQPQPDNITTDRPVFLIYRLDGTAAECSTVDEWRGKMLLAIDSLKSLDKLKAFRAANGAALMEVHTMGYEAEVAEVDRALTAKTEAAEKGGA